MRFIMAHGLSTYRAPDQLLEHVLSRSMSEGLKHLLVRAIGPTEVKDSEPIALDLYGERIQQSPVHVEDDSRYLVPGGTHLRECRGVLPGSRALSASSSSTTLCERKYFAVPRVR